jgi:GrpB-like predicted nucleotidyltransferase (UPF0157 family)
VKTIKLKTVEELEPKVKVTLAKIFAKLARLFPEVEAHHIGATAIPGSLTKGDVDVLLRVPKARFQTVVKVLRQHFTIKQAGNWTPEFASFGDDARHVLPAGIQVVIEDSSMDFFLFLRDYFISHRDALDKYNRLRLIHAAEGQKSYRKAKNEFLEKILTLR